MCWSLDRWGEIETLRASGRNSDRAVAQELETLLAEPARGEAGTEPARRDDRVPELAGRATSGTGA
ncbi:MAG: hypothetical protein AAB152_10095 [Candidatus Coatesbacteria bacterium]